MNTRAFTLALVIAAGAMFMVWTYIEDQKSALIQTFGLENSVVVAKIDIKEFELIDDSKVTVMNVPAKFRAPGHFKTVKEVENTIATVPMIKGEQITKPRVTYPGAGTGLSRQVSVGKRAMAIVVNNKQAAGKLIKPGDRIDLMARIDYAGGKKEFLRMMTVLQDALVLSTGYDISNNIPLVGIKTDEEIRKLNLSTYTQYTTVTLELDPFQAQKVAFIIENLDPAPYLMLRNNNDKNIVNMPATKLFDVLGQEAAEAKNYFLNQGKK